MLSKKIRDMFVDYERRNPDAKKLEALVQLEVLVQKAMENGLTHIGDFGIKEVVTDDIPPGKQYQDSAAVTLRFMGEHKDTHSYGRFELSAETVIFNHDFARALFPDPPGYNDPAAMRISSMQFSFVEMWTGVLKDAVVSDNPIDYMYKVVFGE